MKLKKSIIIIICLILVSTLFIIPKKAIAATDSPNSFSLDQVSFADNILVLNVKMKLNDIELVKGIITYDKDIKLTRCEYKTEEFSQCVFVPNLDKEGEKIYYKNRNKKVLGFEAMTSDAVSEELVFCTLSFDISDCKKGKEYLISWDTDDLAGKGTNTRVSKENNAQSLNVSEFKFTLQDESEEEKSEREAREAEQRAAEEAARKKAEEEAAAKKAAEENAKKQAEEEAAAAKKAEEEAKQKAEQEAAAKKAEEARKKAEEEAKKQAANNTTNTTNKTNIANTANQTNTTNTANQTNTTNNTNQAENKANTANTEKMPQTGNANTIIIISSIVVVLMIGIIAYANIRKLRYTK